MFERLEELRENIFRYLEARIELFTLETRGRVEDGAVQAIHAIVLALLSTMTLIFLFSLLAAYLNEVLDSRYLGFLIVAAFFLTLTVLWLTAKESIMVMIRKTAYAAILKNQEKKAKEKSQAVRDLMSQTTTTMQEQGRIISGNR